MEMWVRLVGYSQSPSSRWALLSTEHPFCAYGEPVVIVDTRPYLPIDAVLEGWHLLTNGRDDEEVVQAWRSEVAKYSRYERDRALSAGAETLKAHNAP